MVPILLARNLRCRGGLSDLREVTEAVTGQASGVGGVHGSLGGMGLGSVIHLTAGPAGLGAVGTGCEHCCLGHAPGEATGNRPLRTGGS